MPYYRAFYAQLNRDIRLAFRNAGALLNPPLFFIVVCSLFPFGVGPSPQTLQTLAPGILWVSALLASLVSLDYLFKSDFDDGTLEQMLLCPQPAPLLIAAKITAHWLTTGFPLILISPVLALLLNLPSESYLTLVITLALGTPTLSLIGAIGVGLTVGIARSGLLLSLLVLPLSIPVLIFGASAVSASALGLPTEGQLYLLAAALLFTIPLAPIAVAAALRNSLN